MRLRSDLKFGTITDNPLAIGSTTINSAQFATLPTVAGSDELYLTIDPEGSNREIVKVTAHSPAATAVTVQRGQLGTAAAQHALSTRWVHAAVTTDLVVPCTSSTHPTVGLWAGMRIFETDTGRELVYNGTDWTLPKNVHGGVLGYAERTTSAGPDPFVTITDLDTTNLQVVVTVLANRRVKITGYAPGLDGTVAGDVFGIVIREGLTELNRQQLRVDATGVGNPGGMVQAIETPSAGSHTYKLSALRLGGTGNATFTAATNRPLSILVEDIGGV